MCNHLCWVPSFFTGRVGPRQNADRNNAGRMLLILLATVLWLAALPGCGPDSEPTPADALSQKIGPDGGTITIEKPGNPLNGLSIDVPPKAYPEGATLAVSSRAYDGERSESFHPISPVIHVEGGKAFAEEIVKVTVPIELPEGMFAMGFFVHGDGELEPMPLANLTDRSITVATRHFSEFIIGAIPEMKLKGKISTGFKPGRDDWHFANRGSYISPGGHCAGQSITAAW